MLPLVLDINCMCMCHHTCVNYHNGVIGIRQMLHSLQSFFCQIYIFILFSFFITACHTICILPTSLYLYRLAITLVHTSAIK